MSSRRLERKNQTGLSNASNDGSKSAGASPSKNFRCIMQRIVERDPPELNPITIRLNPKARKVDKMAIWTGNKEMVTDDYSTTNKTDYPIEPYGSNSNRPETERRKESIEQTAMKLGSMEDFRKLVKSEYGHTAKLFKAGRKSNQDFVTPEDFSYMLKRLKLDKQFDKNNQDLIFQNFKKDGNNAVAVIDIISRIDEIDQNDSKLIQAKQDMENVKTFFNQKLMEKRALREAERVSGETSDRSVTSVGLGHSGLNFDDLSGEIEKIKGIDHKDVELKRAIGQKTFDIEVGTEELNDLIEFIYKKRDTKETDNESYARFLRFSNLKLTDVPFYDLRRHELEGRKKLALKFEEECCDSEIIQRYTENRMNKKNIAKELKLLDLEQIALKKLENSSRWGVGSDHPLGPKNLKKINEDDLNSTLDSDNSQNNSPKNNLKNSKNISNDMYDMDDDNTVLTANSSVGYINSLKSKTAPLKSAYANANTTRSKSLKPLSNALFYDTNQSTISDFQPGLVKTTKSRAEDPSMTLLVEPIVTIPKVLVSGKKLRPHPDTDFTRVGYGLNSTLYNKKPEGGKSRRLEGDDVSTLGSLDSGTFSGFNTKYKEYYEKFNSNSEADPYQSASADYFGPPASRMGDADRDFLAREKHRDGRFQTQVKNKNNMVKRSEESLMDKRIQDLFNDKSRNEDNIRYGTTIFANDVKCFRSQPLQIMSRKPFMSRSDRMWGGNANSVQAGINVSDDRNFSSTYGKSYDSQSLRDSVQHLPSQGRSLY